MDLNVDAGEGFDAPQLLSLATSMNVACGGHTGDDQTMAAAVAAAIRAGCAIGAHPSYRDREGFGRRALPRSAEEIAADVADQLSALSRAAVAAGVRLHHVKPHGALYHAAWSDAAVARAVAESVARFDRSLWVYTPPRSALDAAARALGLRVAREGFADRGVSAAGGLIDRTEQGALISDPDAAAARALAWAREGRVRTPSGAAVGWPVDTLCVHSDTPNAAEVLRSVRTVLEAHGLRVAPPEA